MRICLHDRQMITEFLQQDPGLYLYMLGDLDDFYWPHTSWYGWQEDHQLHALALLYSGDDLPVLLAFGHQAMAKLLKSLKPLLPRRFYCHLTPGLESQLSEWHLKPGGRHYRMLLKDHSKLCQDQRAVLLHPQDSESLIAFYQEAYPHNWFNPRMLATGQYMGIKQGPDWQAVAGVHVYAPEKNVAALGNIAVLPACRGQGLGRSITGTVCQQLLKTLKTIGLNVHSENTIAIKTYQSLGFEIVAEYDEWMASIEAH